MMPEPLVFEADDGAGEFVRHRIDGREAPLPVSGYACAKQTPVAALQHCADRTVEKLAGTQRHGQQGKHGDNTDQQPNILA